MIYQEECRILHDLYDEIHVQQELWLAKEKRFRCPSGCTSCCTNFEPEVLPIEAYYAAIYLIEHQPILAEKLAQELFVPAQAHHTGGTHGCPFQDETRVFCCTIYPVRPLVCRLFAYCGVNDQKGNVRFKICRFHPLSQNHDTLSTQWEESQLLSTFGILPPRMADFGIRLTALDLSSTRTQALFEALSKAIQKILYARQFCA